MHLQYACFLVRSAYQKTSLLAYPNMMVVKGIGLGASVLLMSGLQQAAIAQIPRNPAPMQPSDSIVVQDALDLVHDIGTPSDQVTFLLLSARYAQTHGRAEEVQGYLNAAIQRANEVDSETAQINLLLPIAEFMAENEQTDSALTLIQQSEAIASTMSDPFAQADAYQAIASLYADLLQPSSAAAALALALAAIEEAPPTEAQSLVLATLALQFANLGHPETANMLIATSQSTLTTARANEEIPSPLEPEPWSGNLGLLSNVFSGERTRGIVTLSGGAERQWEHNAFEFSARLTYDFDPDRDDADEIGGQLLTDGIHYFSDDIQYFVNSSVESDNLENLNLRARLSTGIGLNLWEAGSDRRLDLRLGIGARFENFVDEDSTFNPVNATVGLNYQDKWFRILSFKQSLTFDVPVDEASDYLFQAQTELGIPISDRWSFNNTARLTLSGEPADSNPGLLFNLQTGLRYEF